MDKCEYLHYIPTRALTVFLVVLQGTVLDYYLVKYNNWYWYAWIAADLALIFVFITTFVISYRHLNFNRTSDTPVEIGSLPLLYFTWFVYSVLLSIRVGLIFKNFAWKLKEEDFFGPNTLKVNISLSAVIFFLLLHAHHNASYKSKREVLIDNLTKTVVFDILDSVDILDTLFSKRAKEILLPGLEEAILVIACINLILPFLPLMNLSRNHFGYKILPRNVEVFHRLMLLLVVNAPLLAIRVVLWHKLDQDISTFIVKNVFVIWVMLYEFYREGKHRREMELRTALNNTHISLRYPDEEDDATDAVQMATLS